MSLRQRLLKTFLLFQFLLFLPGIAFVFIAFTDGQDTLQETLLKIETATFLEEYQNNPNTLLPSSGSFKGYIGYATIPEKYVKLIETNAPGMYELAIDNHPDIWPEEHEVRVNIAELGAEQPFFYLISDIPEDQTQAILLRNIFILAFTYLLITSLLSYWLAQFFSRKISQPLTQISHALRHSNVSDPEIQLSQIYNEGEVGDMVTALDARNQRIAQFIQRERLVMQNISHELRTPITILKSTLDLIKLKQTPQQSLALTSEQLKKLTRSTQDMEEIIEAFLWLGHENSGIKAETDATAVVEQAILDLQPLLTDTDIQLNVQLERSVTLLCKEKILYIVVVNLLRNALTHTQHGIIHIHLSTQQFSVIDSGDGLATSLEELLKPGVKGKDSSGFGLGLYITQQICERMHWRLSLESRPNKTGTHASIQFDI